MCPNSSRLRRNQSEPASDTQQKQHRQKSVLFLWRALRSFAPCGGKAQRARTACTFGATNPSLLLTHYKSGTDGRCAPLRSFAPAAQGTVCPNSLHLRCNQSEPASDTQQKQHRRKVRALKEFCPLRRKALRARTARTFGATYSSLLLTHNKNSTDKSLCCFCGAPTHFISELFALSNSESVIVSVPSL